MTKRILAILIALCAIAMTGCGNATPSEAVAETLDSFKAVEVNEDILALEELGLSEDTEAAYREFLGKVSDFDYEVTGETISEDENSAVVEVTITTYPFGDAYLDAYEGIYEKYEAASLDEDIIYSELFKTLNSLEEKSASYNVKIDCEKQDGEWVVKLDDNGKFTNAILGDMIYVIKELAK